MFVLLQLVTSFANDNDMRLWYDKPAYKMPLKATSGTNSYNEVWQQNSLPIGNGFIGANVFGEIVRERITFNDKTLWIGGPSKNRPDYTGGNSVEKGRYGQTLHEIQKLFEEHKDDEASMRCDQLTGDDNGVFGSYQNFGEIGIDSPFDENLVTDYIRYLDIDKAVITVQFNHNGTIYKREHFVSYPDNVMVIRLSKEGRGKISNDLFFIPSHWPYETRVSDHTIDASGELEDNQLKFLVQMLVMAKGGSIVDDTDKIHVNDADEVIIYISSKTDYKLVHPTYRTGETMEDIRKIVNNRVKDAKNKGYKAVEADFLEDYQTNFNRVKLNLSHAPSQKTTDNLLWQYNQGTNAPEEDRSLEVLLFQYGRYLTLQSSRENNELPSNLQGLWNDINEGVAWNSAYTTNINLEMNYFPTFNTDLHECAIPLLKHVEGLRIPGRISASIYMGVNSTEEKPENGFMVHTQSNPFGCTCPGWEFNWGWSPASVPWLLHNCFEYYEYTKDIEVLREKIYPMMKESATFYEQIIKYEYPDSKLYVSSPAFSPEQGPRTNGNIYEQQIMYQHFTNCIKAAKELNVDSDRVKRWEQILMQLKPPVQIGESGQIKEWFHETTLGSVGEHGHRHLSHLLGLYPLNVITIDNPEHIEAAKISLNDRTYYSTGWGMGHRINTWARTGDGNHAYTLIHNLLCTGIYNNLWDTHPPFQIDGNFAATAGVTEMLIQSNLKEIHILPSLPDAWPTGSVDGLVARGNFKFNISWENMKLKKVSVKARSGGKCRLFYPNIARANLLSETGRNFGFTIIDENVIEFDTIVNSTYIVENIPEIKKVAVPTKVNCFRISHDRVVIHWSKVDSAENYFIYRQIGNNLPTFIGSTTETSFFDSNEEAGAKYYVTTEKDALKSRPAPIVDIQNKNIIDDSDPSIIYSTRFMNIYNENSHNHTLHVLENAKKGEIAEIHFVGSSISVLAKGSDLRALINGNEVEIKINVNSSNKPILVFRFDNEGYHVIKLETWKEDGREVRIDGFIIGHLQENISTSSIEPQNEEARMKPMTAVGVAIAAFIVFDLFVVAAYVIIKKKKEKLLFYNALQYESVS